VSSLIETPFGGRYCGKIAPRLRISLYRALSFVFLSDRENITESRFTGTYTFIPNGKFRPKKALSTPTKDLREKINYFGVEASWEIRLS